MANLHRVRMSKMRADSLAIHPTAQRDKSRPYIKRLMDKFDLDAIGTIHAVEYPINGQKKTWVIDGQHRLAALLELGLGEWEVDVAIHLDVKSDARASELFLKLTSKLNVRPYDCYVNELQAGDSMTVGIDDILRKHGLSASNQSGDGKVACIAALKKSYRRNEGKALDRALGILTSAYGKRSEALEGSIIDGLSLVTSANNGNLEEPALVKKLAKYPGGAASLVGDAKGRVKFHRTISRAIASLIIDTYNIGRRTDRLGAL